MLKNPSETVAMVGVGDGGEEVAVPRWWLVGTGKLWKWVVMTYAIKKDKLQL